MKHKCVTCDHWEQHADLPMTNDKGLKQGLCCVEPPKVQFLQVQMGGPTIHNGVLKPGPQQMGIQMQTYFPVTNETQGCGQHTEYVVERKGAIFEAVATIVAHVTGKMPVEGTADIIDILRNPKSR